MLVTGNAALEPRLGVGPVPSRVATFVRRAAEGGPQRMRDTVGGSGAAQVLDVYASVAPGWLGWIKSMLGMGSRNPAASGSEK